MAPRVRPQGTPDDRDQARAGLLAAEERAPLDRPDMDVVIPAESREVVAQGRQKIGELWDECAAADSFEAAQQSWRFDDSGTLYRGDMSIGNATLAVGQYIAPRVAALEYLLRHFDEIRDGAMSMRQDVMTMVESGRAVASELNYDLVAGHAVHVNGRDYFFDSSDRQTFADHATELHVAEGQLTREHPWYRPPSAAMIQAYRRLAADRTAILGVLSAYTTYLDSDDAVALAVGDGSDCFVFRTETGALAWPVARDRERAQRAGVDGLVIYPEKYILDKTVTNMVAVDSSDFDARGLAHNEESRYRAEFWSSGTPMPGVKVFRSPRRVLEDAVATRWMKRRMQAPVKWSVGALTAAMGIGELAAGSRGLALSGIAGAVIDYVAVSRIYLDDDYRKAGFRKIYNRSYLRTRAARRMLAKAQKQQAQGKLLDRGVH